MRLERLDRERRQRNVTTTAPGLRGLERQSGPRLLKAALDRHRAALQIDSAPGKRRDLASSRAGRQRQDADRLEPVTSQSFEHEPDLISLERLHFDVFNFGRGDYARDVASNLLARHAD